MSTNPDYPPLILPESVDHTQVTISSNGVALDADLFRPKGLADDELRPAVVLAHGWGGDKGTTERYGALLAERLGAIALGFSFATWGESGGQLQACGPDALAVGRSAEPVTTEVKAVRQLVDPLEWLANFRSALDYIEGEPNVDGDRIGAWGTSFGGGIAMHNAVNDPRIKALCVQVAAIFQPPETMQAAARRQAIAIARGDRPAVPQQGPSASSQLDGTAHYARMVQYNVMVQVGQLNIPTLMVDAGSESMFDIRENSGRVYEELQRRNVPARYEILSGLDHYDIYFEGFEPGSSMACDWFSEHL